jgi:hypothetical protein
MHLTVFGQRVERLMCVNDIEASGGLLRRTDRRPNSKAQQKGYSAQAQNKSVHGNAQKMNCWLMKKR